MTIPYLKNGKRASLGDGALVGRSISDSNAYMDRMYGKKTGESVATEESQYKKGKDTRNKDIPIEEYI